MADPARPPGRNGEGLRGLGRGGTGRRKRNARRYATALQEATETALGKNLIWSVVFVIALTPILSQQQCSLPAPEVAVGEVARSTIRAHEDIELIDEAATRSLRESERVKVPAVFDLVTTLPSVQVSRVRDLFSRGRAFLAGQEGGPSRARVAAVREALPYPLSDGAVRTLVARRFDEDLEEAAVSLLSEIMDARVVARREGPIASGPIVIRAIGGSEPSETVIPRVDDIIDLDQARRALRERIAAQQRPPEVAEALAAVVEAHIVPNLSYNALETENRRERAMASVPQVFTRIPRGRVIVREGEIFTREAMTLLTEIAARSQRAVNWKGMAGSVILLSLVLVFVHRYVVVHQRVFKRVKNLYTMVLSIAAVTAFGAWAGAFLAEAVSERFLSDPFNDPARYRWMLPVAAGGMLMTLLANVRVAMVSSSVNALLVGALLGWDAGIMVFALVSSFAGIYGVSKYERRTAILKASVWVALVNAGLALSITWLQKGMDHAPGTLFDMASAAAGGILVAPVVSFGLPILEWLFNVLTDIRLLELSNMDNPLLRRLSLQAPGTYNHSIIMGTLAEQAAEEIGAHALLCRVAANYHDIGKMLKPDYFVENMRDGVNRHDKLSPRMSSLIIASHVKEGLKLADEYNLPRQIRDMIPQHHGTRLITFFYRKAKRREDPDVPEIHESDYRYPGPKPQTKEAAIVMMADSIEAAARSVEDPTPAKFEEVIDRMSNAIVLDHQLDECDLTFSDLGKIRAAFLKTLTAVHHHRISYPGYVFDRSKPRAAEAE